MFDNWFTTRCMTLVDRDGVALEGVARKQAEDALDAAKLAKYKVWADKDGLMCKKAPRWFSKEEPLVDAAGNRLRICGHLVKNAASYCSKCSGDAPGGWWRCGECGKPVGNESPTCPHCGHPMHPEMRKDLSTGSWRQRQGVFAERFDLADLNVLIPYGLNIQENQRGLLLEGGELTQVLEPGHYACEDFRSEEVKAYGEHCIIFVDMSEFSLPLRVSGVFTKGSLHCDVHLELTLRMVSDLEHGKSFIRNLMGRRLLFETGQETVPYELGYNEIMHVLLQMTDDTVRRFCADKSVDELFKDMTLRKTLENLVRNELEGRLNSLGMCLVRLGELDFESEVFDKLREQEGEIEEQRRRNEFMLEADRIANDATKRKIFSEQEMEDYMADLAQRAKIRAGERERELERIRRRWQYERVLEELTYDCDLADEKRKRELQARLAELNNQITLDEKRRAAEYKKVLDGKQNEIDVLLMDERIKEIQRRIEEADNTHRLNMESATRTQKLRLDIEEARAWIILKREKEHARITTKIEEEKADQEITRDWLDIKAKKNRIDDEQADRDANRRILFANAAAERQVNKAKGMNGLSREAIMAAEDDPDKRRDLLEYMRLEMSTLDRKSEKERDALLLAVAAAKGNHEADERIKQMEKEYREQLDKAVRENIETYKAMVAMSERMFNQVIENLNRPSTNSSTSTTNQFVK